MEGRYAPAPTPGIGCGVPPEAGCSTASWNRHAWKRYDIATVWSPRGRRIYPSVIEGQTLGQATGDRHEVEVLHHTRGNSSDESHGQPSGEKRSIIDARTLRRGKGTHRRIDERKKGNPRVSVIRPVVRKGQNLAVGDQSKHRTMAWYLGTFEIRCPSGGHDDNRCSLPPDAGATQRSNPSSTKREKAICRPSGDHLGQQSEKWSVNRSDFSLPTAVV